MLEQALVDKILNNTQRNSTGLNFIEMGKYLLELNFNNYTQTYIQNGFAKLQYVSMLFCKSYKLLGDTYPGMCSKNYKKTVTFYFCKRQTKYNLQQKDGYLHYLCVKE